MRDSTTGFCSPPVRSSKEILGKVLKNQSLTNVPSRSIISCNLRAVKHYICNFRMYLYPHAVFDEHDVVMLLMVRFVALPPENGQRGHSPGARQAIGAKGQEWDSLAKWRRVMQDIILHAQKHEFIPESCKPLEKVDVPGSSSNYEAIVLTPKQTFAMLNSLPLLQQTMVVLDAATGIRYSEMAGLQWKDVDWEDKRIYIERRWIRGDVHKPKTPASRAAVAMSDVLAAYLLAWRKETMYGKDTDWIFASSRTKGETPRVGNMLVRSYLYPAAVKAGVLTTTNIKVTRTVRKKGKKEKAEVEVPIYFDRRGKRVKRFGFHQFRHSLPSFLTTKKKVDPKTAQTALRQSDSRFTMDKYTQTDHDELMAAQNLMLDAIFKAEPGAVQ